MHVLRPEMHDLGNEIFQKNVRYWKGVTYCSIKNTP